MGTSAGEGPDGQECSFPAVSVIDRVTGIPRTLYTGTGARQANHAGPLSSGLAASDLLALDKQRGDSQSHCSGMCSAHSTCLPRVATSWL